MDTTSSNTKIVSPHLFVCRHGERIDFVDKGWWSRSTRPFDPHLSEHGYEQAKHLAERLDRDPQTLEIKHILCSPYVRCIETIYPFASAYNIPIKIEHGLSEWFAKTVLQDLHLPLSTEELHAQFPLVDVTYQSNFSIDMKSTNELDVHTRLYEVAKYVVDTFYSPSTYSGDVMLVTHAAGVIAAVRGFLTLKQHPNELGSEWYAHGGQGRVSVYAGVSGVHKLSQNSSHLDWLHVASEDETHLLDPVRNYNWAYRPDRPKL